MAETVKYTDWLAKVDDGSIDVKNVNWTAKMVHESYIPDVSHKPTDVKPYIIASAGSLQGSEFSDNVMSSIMDIMKTRLRAEIASEPDDAIQKVDEMDNISDEEKKALKQLITQTGDSDNNTLNWWNGMIEAGMKFIVVESPNKNVLCFCEEIF